MLHLEQLREEIEALGQRAAENHRQCSSELDIALRWLTEAPDAPALRERVKTIKIQEEKDPPPFPPTDEPLARRIPCPALPIEESVLVAVDGSQITPDRHAAVLYYLIQVGGLIFRYNGNAPLPFSEAELHFEESDLLNSQGLLITSELGMRRTVAEMAYLAHLTAVAEESSPPLPVIALTDGPLLWPYTGQSKEEENALPAYFTALTALREAGGLPAGFIERPGGSPLLELLWASRLTAEGTPIHKGEAPLRALTDHELMTYFLSPGERSSWLERPSAMNARHSRHGHPIWFCYLNVGEVDYPVIARIEVPQWACRDGWIDRLHAILIHQARVLHGNPYVLARAHELALVTSQDKAALEALLQRQLFERGIVARTSEKARQKAYLGGRQ